MALKNRPQQQKKQKSSKKWANFGTVRQPDENRSPYIVVNKNVEIYVNGEKIELGRYRQIKLMDPKVSINRLLEMGVIDESDHEQRENFIDQKGVIYEAAIPPVDESELEKTEE